MIRCLKPKWYRRERWWQGRQLASDTLPGDESFTLLNWENPLYFVMPLKDKPSRMLYLWDVDIVQIQVYVLLH